jgi:hypothetical protein
LREFMKHAQIPAKTSVHVNGFNAAAFKKPPYSFVTQHNILKGHVREKSGNSMLEDWREDTRSYDSMQHGVYERITSKLMPLFSGLMTRRLRATGIIFSPIFPISFSVLPLTNRCVPGIREYALGDPEQEKSDYLQR